jgi:RimJ/RimL family protein N-acetyltransferase
MGDDVGAAAAHGAVSFAFPRRVVLRGVTLRAWAPADAPLLAAALAASEAHLRAWTPWVVDGRVPGLTLEQRLAAHAADFDAGREWVYGMFDPAGVEVLGGCGLYPRVGPNAVEIGYWLAVGHTGRGLATRAAEALTRLAFDAPEIERVEIRCDVGNDASARIPRRLGYRVMDPRAATPDRISPTLDNLVVWEISRPHSLHTD